MSGFPKRKRPNNMRVLGDWVREYADQRQVAESRVRRAVSFMLVALPLEHSLDGEGQPLFAVKGGVSMELRLGLRARTTKDLDAVFRGAFEGWLAALDDALADDIEDFSFSREEPEAIRGTKSFRVNIIIDFKGKRWGKVQFEVAPVEVSSVLDVDQVDPFDIGQFGLRARPDGPTAGPGPAGARGSAPGPRGLRSNLRQPPEADLASAVDRLPKLG